MLQAFCNMVIYDAGPWIKRFLGFRDGKTMRDTPYVRMMLTPKKKKAKVFICISPFFYLCCTNRRINDCKKPYHRWYHAT